MGRGRRRFVGKMEKTTIYKGLKALSAFFAVLLLASWLSPIHAVAQNSTAYTYTVSVDGQWIRTQDAYLAGAILFRDMGLKKPEDIYIDNDRIYIADTGGKRIAVMDRKSGSVSFIGEGLLSSPTGVFACEDGNILVADYGLGKVVLLSPEGNPIKWYERPDSPIFGKTTNYKPRKAVSDKRGNIYIVSEGSYDGIIQLSKEGEFLGYFGANTTGLSLVEMLQDLFFTEEQKAKLFNRIPRTFYNIAIDNKGMVYSITQSVRGDAIKKHNVSGANILEKSGKMLDESNFVAMSVGRHGQIYAVSETGLVYEYDSTGSLIFSFGGRAISSERNGLFTVASGVAADENNFVYVLDKERGIVQVFYPTTFAAMTHEAITLFESGKYAESKEIWQEILKLSGISRMAHNGLGKGYFQAGEYEAAAKHFKIAQNREDYSETYWEIRNKWLQENAGLLIIAFVILLISIKLLKYLDKRTEVFSPYKKMLKRLQENKFISDVLYLKNFIKHPIDSFYYIKKDLKGSVWSATAIYFLALVVFTADFLFRGFILNPLDAREVSYIYVILLFLAPIALWVSGNYMVSSINEGEGRIKDVYCATAYSLAPFIIFMPFVTALTYVVTLNEEFIISFSTLVIWVWCAIILFIGLKEIHDYEIHDMIKNILLTLFFMFVAVLVFSIIYMLWDQGIEFVRTIIKEVAYRVR